ncbi:MAG: DUF1700 domain-containing protein [Lachnospiraceae bacterium]|nr:DUF1700 domain-containing protein [Lachnospiraceae bacterium]
MNKAMFMSRLRELLADITEAEREEALNYYEDYFDDAGEENEESVIEALGSPERVAATIKEGLNDNTGSDGEFSENGYTSGNDRNREEVAARTLSSEERGFGKKKGLSSGTLVLILILCLFALPILGPLTIGVLSAVFGILCAISAVLFSLAIVGIALVVAGIALFVCGFITLFESPVVGILLMGGALVLAGIGVLITILGIWLLVKVIPPIVRGIVNLCRKPFQRKKD